LDVIRFFGNRLGVKFTSFAAAAYEIMDLKDPLVTRFLLNMKRVNDLLGLIRPDRAPLKSERELESDTIRGDIARAVVVFLHATFEDLLRTAARQRLDAAKWQDLNVIPLVGSSRSGRAEKFNLGALASHRGKTVDQLIHDSVEAYLNRRSFGSCDEVEEVLLQIGLDTKPFKHLYTELDQLMKRRHRIVHEADLESPKDSVSPPWTSGDEFLLCLWWVAVMTFHALLCVSVDPADPLQSWYSERRLKAIESYRHARADILSLQYRPGEAIQLAQKIVGSLKDVIAFLGRPSDEELRAIAEKMEPSN
jgi:hypothetical protein